MMGGYVAVAIGPNCNQFSGIIKMNEMGHAIFQKLHLGTEESIVAELLKEYDATEAALQGEVRKFTQYLADQGALEL